MKKYKAFIAYAVFGILTTIVNILTYNLCYYKAGWGNTLSNIIAWVLAVTFAYLTNKVWVFDSKSWDWQILRKEVPAFISCRLATGVMDLIIMVCHFIILINIIPLIPILETKFKKWKMKQKKIVLL